MTYDSNNNPAPANKIRQFPGQVSTNMWPRLQTMIGADHQFNASAATNDGWHKVIHMIAQSTPTAIPLTPQMYSKTLVGANTYPFVKYPDSAAGALVETMVPPMIATGAFLGTGTPGACAPVGVPFNCSCARAGLAGQYIVTITNPPTNSKYIPFVQMWYSSLVAVPITQRILDKTATTITIQFNFITTPFIGVDPDEIYVYFLYIAGTP